MNVKYDSFIFALLLWESHVLAVWLGQATSIKRFPYMVLIVNEAKLRPGTKSYSNGGILSSTLVLSTGWTPQ